MWISGQVIHGRIKAHIFDTKFRHMRFQFMKGNQGTDRIMPSGTGKTQKQRQVGVQLLIVTRKLEFLIIVFRNWEGSNL